MKMKSKRKNTFLMTLLGIQPSPRKLRMIHRSLNHIVQLGAFTTKTRADERAAFAMKKLSKEIIVSYSDEFKLYVVQLRPFATKDEADQVRNELWKSKDFKDAFIVVIP